MSTSSKDNGSFKSWGTPQLYIAAPVSPPLTWGTVPTTISSNPSLQAAIDHKVPWPQGWSSNAPPPLYSSPSSISSNPPSVGNYGGYSSPSPLVSPSSGPASSWSRLSSLLDSRSPQCIEFDLGYPLNYMPNMSESAVQPPVTFMQLSIVVQQSGIKWPVNIQVHGPVSVYHVLQQLHEYLQGYLSMQDRQKSKIVPGGHHLLQSSDRFREQSHPHAFHSGQRRIDLLGRHRIFRGLSLDPGPNCVWAVYLSDR